MNDRHRIRRQNRNDLSAWLELGATDECIALAKQALRQRPITAHSFAEAVEAILIEGDQLTSFKRLLLSAFQAVPKKNRQMAQEKMFWFLVSDKDWEHALNCIPKRLKSATSILFAMWTYLELKRMKEAERVNKIAIRRLKAGDDDHSESSLSEAIASYFYACREWELAWMFWDYGSDLKPFGTNAIEGKLKARLRLELDSLRESATQIRDLIESPDDPLPVYKHNQELMPEVSKRIASHTFRLETLVEQIERGGTRRKHCT